MGGRRAAVGRRFSWRCFGMILFVLLLYAPHFPLTDSSPSALTSSSTKYCFFNQLCSCKVVSYVRGGGGGEGGGGGGGQGSSSPRQQSVDDFGNVDYYDGAPVVTQRTPPPAAKDHQQQVFQGQFGSIATE